MVAKKRTLPIEIERLTAEGVDPRILSSKTIQFLMEEIIGNELYEAINSEGEPDVMHAKSDGTFDLKTENINGFTMQRLSGGDILLHKTEYLQKELPIGSSSIKYNKKVEEEIVLNQDGEPISQNWVSQKRHRKLL